MRAETQAAIRAAGVAQRLADSRDGAERVTSKGGIDLVTMADVKCEDAIRVELGRAFPDYPIVGEERGGSPSAGLPYWLVDPICGTRPYASDIPLYCTNIALVEDGVVSVAAVGVGRTGEIVYAERGVGAWVHTVTGDPHVHANSDSHTVWISGKTTHAATVVRNALLAERWYVCLFPSSVAYAYLATGRLCGIVHIACASPVHSAAGCRIAEEAGAVITDLEGHAWTPETHSLVLAATPSLHEELRDLVERSR